MTTHLLQDRQIVVAPDHVILTAWIDIDLCRLGNRARMDIAAVERAYRRLLQLDGGQLFPPINGCWDNGQFVVYDGRHEFLAALALGRERVFVAWLTEAPRGGG